MELGIEDPIEMMARLPAHTFEQWKQYMKIKAWEHEQQMKKAKKGK